MDKELRVYLFIEKIINSVNNSMKCTKKLSELMSMFRKSSGYKINIQKSIVFLYISNKQLEIEI